MDQKMDQLFRFHSMIRANTKVKVIGVQKINGKRLKVKLT